MAGWDIEKSGEGRLVVAVVVAAAAVARTVVREGKTVLLLCECVVGETEMKLPLMSNTSDKQEQTVKMIRCDQEEEGREGGGGGIRLVASVDEPNGETPFFPSSTASNQPSQVLPSPFFPSADFQYTQ